ncbi:hypothetical protein BDV95DRAFT_559676 [Massariosphaeria phaeospora]|uniref:Ubiquitin 3 binding protein But2 C-terminal domain-containing protein n=1 Tax=Massariosphaeria phaeospora TaxID=100035 RepID=A0A7C8MIE7_9PLEO|nr:hypothetical protein BDV95DRAFT_559676 [Massariosphaeria phaeospora]
MQYTTFLAALLASGAVAAPSQRRYAESNVQVTLRSFLDIDVNVPFTDGKKEEKDVPGTFKTALLTLGAGVGKATQRCEALDRAGKPLIVERNGNIDRTFADAKKGEWKFINHMKEPVTAHVSKIVCDPAFQKIGAKDKEITVILNNSASESQTQTQFTDGTRREVKKSQDFPFKTVELNVGPFAEQQSLRCQVLDKSGNPIKLQRGANLDTTFGDGSKGAWTFVYPDQVVSEIVCDPLFVKAA